MNIHEIWSRMDVVGQGVLYLLLSMSFMTWYIFAGKLLLLWQHRRNHMALAAALPSGAAVPQELPPHSLYAQVMGSVSDASGSYREICGHFSREEWLRLNVDDALELISRRLGRGLSYLGTVASISPFVGLFGTVWGIYHALIAIGQGGQASLDHVAGPVGESLVMTAFGLAVAIPAVFVYNWFSHQKKIALEPVRDFSQQMIYADLRLHNGH